MQTKEKYAIFGLLSIVILCCILKKEKEGYTILGEDKYIKLGNAFRADECHDECEKDPTCKYVNRPAKLKSWEKGECWKSGQLEQHVTGAIDNGNFKKEMVTWENKNYIKPSPSVYDSTSGGYTFKERESAANHCKSKGKQLCTSSQIINNKGWGDKKGNMKVNLCNSGWTTDKRGWWVGYAKSGCGTKAQVWESWWKPSGSAAHCCTKGYLDNDDIPTNTTYYCSAGNDEKLGTFSSTSNDDCVTQCRNAYGSRSGWKCKTGGY